MARRFAVFLFMLLFCAVPATSAQGNQQITAYSDATYPQEWRLINDYWFNATTFLLDERTFHVRLSIPDAGDYAWQMPESGGVRPDLPNPLSRLFTTFQVTRQGSHSTWDLARMNATPTFHADGANDVVFTLSYCIRDLSPYDYSELVDQTRAVRDAERDQWPDGNIVSHVNEVSGFIRLQQVTSDSESASCPSGTCADITHLVARDFNLVFNLTAKAFQLLFHQASEIPVSRTSGGVVSAAGSSYTSNAAFDATITATGNLTKHGVSVTLDSPTGRLVAHLDPGHSVVRTKLPGGDHRFYYVFNSDEPAFGSISVRSPRSTTYVLDAVALQPNHPEDIPLWWLALAALALILFALAVRRRRFTWYEYQRGNLYLVVDAKGRKATREHHGRPPPFVRIRQPNGAR